MKKLLAIIPAALLLGACANVGTFHHTMSPVEQFTCEGDNNSVNASYSRTGDRAELNVNVPSLSLTNTPIVLTQAPAASGMRFVNDQNPNVVYEWHTKNDDGLLAITMANGTEYSLVCQK